MSGLMSLDELDEADETMLNFLQDAIQESDLADIIKASFGGDRSEAGRYAANVRWKGQGKGDDKKYPKELTTKEMVNILYEAKSVQDALGLIAKSLGKDAKPQLRVLDDSEVTHYRGASDPTASIGFVIDWSLNDIPYATWGQGLYITPLREEASIYGKPYRVNLDKSAKLIIDEIPWSEGDKWLKVKSSEPYESSKVVNYSKLKFNPSGSDLINFYWASKGYDGAFIQGDEVVLFNGSKLTVDKRDLSSKEIKKFLTNLVKASFGGDRSEAGRYAANIRWQNQASEKGTGFISPTKMPKPILFHGQGHNMLIEDANFLKFKESNADLPPTKNSSAIAVKKEVVEGIVAGMQNITEQEIENANDALGLPLSNLPNDFGRQEMLTSFAQHFVDQWANTSNDHETDSLMVQEVVKRVFNLEDSATVDTFENFPDIKAVQKTAENILKDSPQLEKVLTALVKAQYANTQAYLASKGITEVWVSRGMNHPNLAEELKDYRMSHFYQIEERGEIELEERDGIDADERNSDITGNISDEEFDKFVPEGVVTVNMKMRPLSSFSVTRSVADGFRDDAETSGAKDIGVFLSTKVPVSRIFSTPLTGVGCLDEDEFVILGGELTATASRSSAGDEDFNYDDMFPSKNPKEIKTYG